MEITLLTAGDGCVFDTKDIHKIALNRAIGEIAGQEFTISEDDHLKLFDGKKTHEKLSLLNARGMPPTLNERIWYRKQTLTMEYFEDIPRDERLINVFGTLKARGFKLACCSNAIRQTLELALEKVGIKDYFDIILANEDCASSKPHPELYWKAMIYFSALPEKTLIIEDSPVGLLAAYRSGAKVLRVKNPSELTLENIYKKLQMKEEKKTKWVDKNLNVLILAAGKGSRFEEQKFSYPKPLIPIRGEPMIKVVIDSLGIDANYIFVIRKEHNEKYHMGSMLNLLCPGCRIIEVSDVTEGAACSALLAKEFIDNDQKLIIANSDQMPVFDSVQWMYQAQEQSLDGSVLTFENFSPAWSYIKNDEDGFINEVAEKVVISNRATCGVYYWGKGSDFVWGAEKMIAENKRTLGEFYLFPTYKELIEKGKRIKEFAVDLMLSTGTPEQLQDYLEQTK